MTAFYWSIEFIACFIEAYVPFSFCNLFLYSKTSMKYKVITSLLIAMMTIIFNHLSLVSLIATSLIICMYLAAQYWVRKKDFFKLIIVVMLYASIVFVIDYIFSVIICFSLSIKIMDVMMNGMSLPRTIIVLSSKILLIIIVNMMSKSSSKNMYFNRKLNIIFGLSSMIIIILSTTMYLTQTEKIEYNVNIFMLLFFLIMLVMILVIYFTLMYMMKSEQKKKELALIEQQNKMLYNNMIEQERTFKLWKQSIHDYKHKMLAMDSLLDENNYAEIHNIIKNEINLFRDKAFFISTGNKMVDIILNSKMSIANENNIKFTFNVMLGKELKTDDLDLSVILGNLLDNAIEAVRNEEEKLVHVQMNFIKDMIAIKVINTCTKASIPSDTTKADKELHGIGLKSVQRCVEKYDGNFSLELKNGCVTALVTI